MNTIGAYKIKHAACWHHQEMDKNYNLKLSNNDFRNVANTGKLYESLKIEFRNNL
jgi:hypothetical protein